MIWKKEINSMKSLFYQTNLPEGHRVEVRFHRTKTDSVAKNDKTNPKSMVFLQNEPKPTIFHAENKGRINMKWKLQNEPKLKQELNKLISKFSILHSQFSRPRLQNEPKC
jgi:hypothetical protein